MSSNHAYPDPTPDVPVGVVNKPRQLAVLRQYAAENGTFSDERGYLSGAIDMVLRERQEALDALEFVVIVNTYLEDDAPSAELDRTTVKSMRERAEVTMDRMLSL
jgi:hypothetical protein